MKRAIALAVLFGASVFVVSCGGYSNPSTTSTPTSGLTFRAFVSNPLSPATGGGGVPVLNIVDASKDVLSAARVNLSGSAPQAGMMAVAPDKLFTMVYSASSNSLVLVDNRAETVVASGTASLPAINLPGPTESMFVSKFNVLGYVAVPTAPVLGQSPGAVVRIALSAAAINAVVPIPAVRFIVESHDGNNILALADNSNLVTLVAPSLIGTTDPLPTICCFDHPVWGIFDSSDTTAYVLNCGPQCGGTAASVSVVDIPSRTVTATIPVTAATMGVVSGNTLYVAGTAPSTPCGAGTAATTCGTLTMIDLGSLTVTGTATISDGYHTRMEVANGQIFIGARNCTNINIPKSDTSSGEVRGCLSIFTPTNSKVVIPPDNGDVTGIQPITNRTVVYVCEGGSLRIYDTNTDTLQPTQVDITGQAIDVRMAD